MIMIHPFTETNSARDFIRYELAGASSTRMVREARGSYVTRGSALATADVGWRFVQADSCSCEFESEVNK